MMFITLDSKRQGNIEFPGDSYEHARTTDRALLRKQRLHLEIDNICFYVWPLDGLLAWRFVFYA